jgi:hypothetical protein
MRGSRASKTTFMQRLWLSEWTCLGDKASIGGGRSAKPTVRGFWVTSGSGSYGFPRPGAVTPCPGAVAPCPAAVWLHAPALWLHAPALWLHAPQLCGSANIVQRPRDCSTARKEDNSRACRWFWRGRGGEGARGRGGKGAWGWGGEEGMDGFVVKVSCGVGQTIPNDYNPNDNNVVCFQL